MGIRYAHTEGFALFHFLFQEEGATSCLRSLRSHVRLIELALTYQKHVSRAPPIFAEKSVNIRKSLHTRNTNMGIYIRISDKAIIDAVSNMRGSQPVVNDKTLLEMCPIAHSIYYRDGMPVGYLISSDTEVDGLRLTETQIPRFGKFFDLYEPNRRTAIGKHINTVFEQLQQTTRVAYYALDLIGPKIKSKLLIDEFGFDYRSQARLHFIGGEIFIGLVGISVHNKVYDQGHGVQLICREEYRAAVKQAQVSSPKLLFTENDSLVLRAKQALDPFISMELPVVNALLSDIYQRVIVEPDDVKHYIPHLLLPRELTYVFTTLVGILHAFYGVE